jgi:hypothetical protein
VRNKVSVTAVNDPTLIANEIPAWLQFAAAALVTFTLVMLFVVWKKGRPFAPGDVFRASRMSSGNRIFPTQVLISPTSVVHYTPQWVGRLEHSMHMAHVASVRIDTNLMFSDVYIETTGGASPIRCHGHRKSDAVRMKELIEKYQTDYYRAKPSASN